MASFCGSCGFPQAAGAAFCPNCGARHGVASATTAPAPIQQPVQAQPGPVATMAPAKSSSGLKVVLAILGVMVLLGITAIAGMLYVGHRVKMAVVDKAKSYGVELPSDTGTHTSTTRALPAKTCDLLSKADASNLLGEPIERVENTSEGCSYFGPSGLSTTLAKNQMNGAVKKAEAPGSQVNPSDMATAVDQLANSIAAEQGGSNGSGGEMPLLMMLVDKDGQAQMTAISASKALFGGLASASGATGMTMGSDVPNLGDRAIRLPKLGLNVLKGSVLLRLIPGPIPDADQKTITIARTVLAKF